MSKQLYTLLLLLLMGAGTLPAQTPAAPQALTLPGLQPYYTENPYLIPGRIIPVGWSPDGKFAYGYEKPDEACGCYLFEFCIQDMVTDSMVWRYDYIGDRYAERPDSLVTDFAGMWKLNGKYFLQQCERLGIKPSPYALRSTGPGCPDGIEVDFVTTEVDAAHSELGIDVITAYEVKLLTAKGKKTVFRYRNLYSGIMELSVAGYYKSPYEPRVAILIQEMCRGYEGTPHVLQYRFTGCDLSKGWK